LLGKEYVEVHGGGRTAILNDFASLETLDGSQRRKVRERSREKGHRNQFVALSRLLDGETEQDSPSPLSTMAVTLAALRSALTGQAVDPRVLDAALELETRCGATSTY
jgi:hypothetical protein